MADEVAQTESWTLPTLCQDTCSGSQPPCLEQNDTKWLQCFSKTKENKAAIFDHHLLMEVLQHWFWDTSKFPNFVHRDKPQEWSVSRSCFASFTWCGGQLLVGLTCPNRIWLGYRVARSRGGVSPGYCWWQTRNPGNSPVDVGSSPHDLQGLGYISRWFFGISSIHSIMVSWSIVFFSRMMVIFRSGGCKMGEKGHVLATIVGTLRSFDPSSFNREYLYMVDVPFRWTWKVTGFLEELLCESLRYYFVLFLLFLPCDSWQIISLFNTEQCRETLTFNRCSFQYALEARLW